MGDTETTLGESNLGKLSPQPQSHGETYHSYFDEDMWYLALELGGYHVEAGARTFADYARRLIADVGDSIRPHLKWSYVIIRDYPGMAEIAKEMDDSVAVWEWDLDAITV